MARTAKTKDTTGTGKRKNAIARIILKSGDGQITVNGKDYKEYFGNREALFKKLFTPFEITGTLNQFNVTANIRGGGMVGQADSLMYAVAKALCADKADNRNALKAAGLLSRDSRVKERKKYGQKKARKKFQFSKR